MSTKKPTGLERIVKGFFDGACITTDYAGVAFSRITKIETAGRYGLYNKDTHDPEMGKKNDYKVSKALGAASGVGLHIVTGGSSLVYGPLVLNGIKASYHAGSGIYRRLFKRNENT